MKKVKRLREGDEIEIFNDEMYVEMVSGLGSCTGGMIMPLKMKDLLIEAYKKSGAVKSRYMFIDRKEVK